MSKVYNDSNGVQWQMFDVDGQREPPYGIPDNCHTAIQQYMENHIKTIDTAFCEIPLPYFSVPMWVLSQENIESVLSYLYCVCCTCGSILDTPAQLILLITLGINIEPWLNMTWRIGMRGMCCSPDLIRNNSYYQFMLYSQNALSPSIEHGWDAFIPIIDAQCTMFACDHDVCMLTKKIILENNLYTSTDDQMNDLLGFFQIIKLDVVGPLLNNSSRCARKTCGVPLKYAKENRIMCDNCRRIMYCSDGCIEKHHCASYCDVWSLH